MESKKIEIYFSYTTLKVSEYKQDVASSKTGGQRPA